MTGNIFGKIEETGQVPAHAFQGMPSVEARATGDASTLGKVSAIPQPSELSARHERPTTAGRGLAGRLVVVSNRVAEPRRDRKAGGLAVAVSETLAASGGVWFGWSGEVGDDTDKFGPLVRRSKGIELVTLDLTPRQVAGYYHGFANQCLWPLLHYRPDLVRFDREFLRIYRNVNRHFAETLANLLHPDDLIWVHDFHLLPLGAELRRRGCKQSIGFFLHVPFPPAELVATLPGHRELIGELLDYDLIGFQTENDAACFRAYVQRELGGKVLAGVRLQAGGREVLARAFPVGIDVDAFKAQSNAPQAERHIARLRSSLGERALIVGVDRLDYSKGLPQRFSAYRRFLESYSQYRNRVVLMQISPPTREELDPYAETRRELDRLEGEIHGQFAEFDWAPVRYIRRPVSRERLAALYRASRVGLVTPLRDGMNLVAKEFVAAQDAEDPGVLILSCFAGAAESMTEALIVNPYDVDQIAGALHDALRMPLSDRQARHSALLASIKRQDVHAWRCGFLAALTGRAVGPQQPVGARSAVEALEDRPLVPAPLATSTNENGMPKRPNQTNPVIATARLVEGRSRGIVPGSIRKEVRT